MHKKLLTMAFACGLAFQANAEKQVLINNTPAERNDVAEITFAGDNLLLKYADGNSFKLDMEEVEINFSDLTSTGVATSGLFSLNTLVDDRIVLTGVQEGNQVQIINIEGRVLFSTTANANEVNIATSFLEPAPYLIKVGNQIIKFIKK